MNYDTVADIFSAKEKARARMEEVVRDVSPEEAAALPSGEKWTIQHIVEHVSMVDSGISRLCLKLTEDAKASGRLSYGVLKISDNFRERSATLASAKVEAPERVWPTGEVTIEEALHRLKENRSTFDAVRADMEKYDVSVHKFPHPYFGDLSAPEWLIVAGGHEFRHVGQIERLLGTIRK